MKRTAIIAIICLTASLAGAESPPKVVKGGDSLEKAEAIEFNRYYRLGRNLKAGEFAYFWVPVEPDLVLTLSPGLMLMDPSPVPIGHSGVLEKSGEPAYWVRNAPQGSMVIAFGSTEPIRGAKAFKVSALPFRPGDLNTDRDAGSNPLAALVMEPGIHYAINTLGGGDSEDHFLYWGKEERWYNLTLHAEDPKETAFEVKVIDPDDEEVLSYVSGREGHISTQSFEAPETGEYEIRVSALDPQAKKSLYRMELTEVAASEHH